MSDDSGVAVKKRKATFAANWLEDERYKPWIQRVDGDVHSFYCSLCKKTLSCGSGHVKRHHDSHSVSKPCAKSDTGAYKQKFCMSWLEDRRFKSWLQRVPNDPYSCKCLFCGVTFSGGKSKLERHLEVQEHKTKSEQYALLVNNNSVCQVQENVQPFDERRPVLEIQLAAFIALKQTSFTVGSDFLDFFQGADDNADLINNMKMGRNKCRYIIENVICKVETDRIANCLRNNKFSIFIDESSDINHRKWMTFLVRHVDSSNYKFFSELFKLILIDAQHSSGEKLFSAFRNEMFRHSIPFTNITSYSSDNANVMMGCTNSFLTRLQKYCPNVIVLACPCHLCALVANDACKNTIPDLCEELMRKIASYVNNSEKRFAIFSAFQECFQETQRRILKYCETRWLSRRACIKRILENWKALIMFFEFQVFSENVETARKTATRILELLKMPEVKVYLLFLKYALEEFDHFNLTFQAEETRVYALNKESEEFLKGTLKHFLKPELLRNENVLQQFFFLKEANHMPDELIDLGPECTNELQKLQYWERKLDLIKVNEIRKNCKSFFTQAAASICKRLPVHDNFFKALWVLHPRLTLSDSERFRSAQIIELIAQNLGGFDISALKAEWILLPSLFSEEERKSLFKKTFDEFWEALSLINDSGVKHQKFDNVTKLANTIRTIGNSNAGAERCFSLFTDTVTKRRNKLKACTTNALCMVRFNLKSRKINPKKMPVDERYLSLMKSKNLYSYEKTERRYLQLFAAKNVDPYDFLLDDE